MKNSIFRICLIVSVFFIQFSCERDELDLLEESFIDIPDINHPETLLDRANREIYSKAYDRFRSKLEEVDGVYQLNIVSGKEIQISETLFNYMKENIDFMNEQIKNETATLIEEEGELLFSYIDLKFDIGLFARQEDAYWERKPLLGTPPSVFAEGVVFTFTSFRSSVFGRHTNISDAFILGGGMSEVDRIESVHVAGHNMDVYIGSACQGSCEYNPYNGYISTPTANMPNGGKFYQIKNPDGNVLVSIRTYDLAGSEYMDDQLGY